MITLEISSYRGISWNAIHYYGSLHINGISFSQEDNLNTYTMCKETYEAERKNPLAAGVYYVELVRPITREEIEKDKSRWNGYEVGDYNVQKICSVAASMATYSFNRKFSEIVHEKCWNRAVEPDELISAYKRAIKSGALFDARCFNIPKEEVTNCILWRQQDATRNSISSAGQAHFSHKQLEGLNSNQIQELLFQEKGINWNDYLTKFKRGSCCIKKHHQTLRSHWTIDNEIPIFKGEGREYIEKLIV